MSATVYIPAGIGGLRSVEVPGANAYKVEKAEDGAVYLHLLTSPYSQKIAMFKTWDHVVIQPDRGPDGRFVKKSR